MEPRRLVALECSSHASWTWCAVNRRFTSTRSLFGDAVLVAFLVAQVCDGVFTYLGITIFGTGIEANPIVAWYVMAAGVGTALVAMKALAVACGATLHFRAMHRTVGVLTVVYLSGAVWPWSRLLWP